MFENLFDHIDTVDERDDAAAVDTRKRIDLAHLLNQPCPGGLATSIGSRLASDAAEQLTFQTIYPGRYALRTPHIQLKILEGDNCNTTTQLHLPEEQNQGLYRTLDYAHTVTQDTFGNTDPVIGNTQGDIDSLWVDIEKGEDAFLGRATIGQVLRNNPDQ